MGTQPKVSPSDLMQAASDVRVRATELLKKHVIPREYHAPTYMFTVVNFDQLLGHEQNLIGHVVKVVGRGMSTF